MMVRDRWQRLLCWLFGCIPNGGYMADEQRHVLLVDAFETVIANLDGPYGYMGCTSERDADAVLAELIRRGYEACRIQGNEHGRYRVEVRLRGRGKRGG